VGLCPLFCFMDSMFDDVKEKIWQLAKPVATSEGMELIHVECLKMHTRWIVRLFLDKDGGVTIADCTSISNQLGDLLDIQDMIKGTYTLEVSSPGFDRPISRDQDFIKYQGFKVDIKTGIKIEGIKNFRGILSSYIEEAGQKFVLVDVSGKTYRIPKSEIVKTNLVNAG